MKYIYLFLFAVIFSTSSLSSSFAQDLDLTKVVADRNTKIFSDGKTTVTGYVNSVLKSKTKCCGGNDDVYMEIKIDDQGYVTSARALSGKNECVKKALADIMKYIRWSVNKETDRPTIFPMIKVEMGECPGSADDNVYNGIPAPSGWAGPSGTSSVSTPIATNKQPATANQPATQPPKTQAPTNQPPTTKPTGSTPANPTNNVGNQPSGTLEKCQSIAPDLPTPKYVSRGNLKPDDSHAKSTLNTSGPIIETPEYVNSKSETALEIKTKLRQKGVCGLAHILAELTIEKDGSVSAYRVFNANTEETRAMAQEIFCDVKFKPLRGNKTYSIFEVKTDIDCPGRSRLNLEQVGYYFVTPEKSARQRVPGGDTLDRPRDN